MRLPSVLVLLVVLGLCTGAAFADPESDMGERWDHPWQGQRATYVEVEPNNDCATGQVVIVGDIRSSTRPPSSPGTSATVQSATVQADEWTSSPIYQLTGLLLSGSEW